MALGSNLLNICSENVFKTYRKFISQLRYARNKIYYDNNIEGSHLKPNFQHIL